LEGIDLWSFAAKKKRAKSSRPIWGNTTAQKDCDHAGNPASKTLDSLIDIDICVKLHVIKASTQIVLTHQ